MEPRCVGLPAWAAIVPLWLSAVHAACQDGAVVAHVSDVIVLSRSDRRKDRVVRPPCACAAAVECLAVGGLSRAAVHGDRGSRDEFGRQLCVLATCSHRCARYPEAQWEAGVHSGVVPQSSAHYRATVAYWYVIWVGWLCIRMTHRRP